METTISETTEEQNVRPQFLKTLCILSFIMCSIMFLFGLMGIPNLFMSANQLIQSNPGLMKLQEMNAELFQTVVEGFKYKDINALSGLLVPIISFIGVLMMWKLKIKGFYIYFLGKILPYIVLFYTTGLTMFTAIGLTMGETVSSIISVILWLVVIFDILFVILYGLNVKYLK